MTHRSLTVTRWLAVEPGRAHRTPIHCIAGDARHAPCPGSCLYTLRSPGCPPFVRTSSCADEAEPMRVSPKQRRSPRHRTMTCSDKTRYESTTCPQNTLKTRKHPQNVSGREAFAHFMEIMGSAVVLPLRGESCTELRGEPGAALSCGEGTERVLPSLNPFSSRIRMR